MVAKGVVTGSLALEDPCSNLDAFRKLLFTILAAKKQKQQTTLFSIRHCNFFFTFSECADTVQFKNGRFSEKV